AQDRIEVACYINAHSFQSRIHPRNVDSSELRKLSTPPSNRITLAIGKSYSKCLCHASSAVIGSGISATNEDAVHTCFQTRLDQSSISIVSCEERIPECLWNKPQTCR